MTEREGICRLISSRLPDSSSGPLSELWTRWNVLNGLKLESHYVKGVKFCLTILGSFPTTLLIYSLIYICDSCHGLDVTYNLH